VSFSFLRLLLLLVVVVVVVVGNEAAQGLLPAVLLLCCHELKKLIVDLRLLPWPTDTFLLGGDAPMLGVLPYSSSIMALFFVLFLMVG